MLAGFLLFIGICFFWQATVMARYERHIAYEKKTVQELQAAFKAAVLLAKDIQSKEPLLKKEKEKIIQRLTFLRESERKNVSWSKVLLRLGELMPQEMWFTKITLVKDAVTIEGRTMNNDIISQFMVKLDENPYFKNTSFQYTQKAKDQGVEFEVVTYLTPGMIP